MVFGIDDLLVGAGAIASAFGGKKKQVTQETQSGFQALPKEVQDLLLNSYLPKVQNTLDMPYQAIPMQRAENPAGDPFASKALWDLQNFSDAAGGYFTPLQAGSMAPNPASYQGAAGSKPAMPASNNAPAGGDLAAQWLSALSAPGNAGTRGTWAGNRYSGDIANALKVQIANGSLTMADINKALTSKGYGKTVTNPFDPSLWQGGF